MPRRVPWACACVLLFAAAACVQSEGDRERKAALRVREQASTRASETVERVSTPQDPHRILYHPPTDLSDTNARLTNAAIVGIAKAPQPTEPTVQSAPPPVKPPH